MDTKIDCLICGSEMKLNKRFKDRRTKHGEKYRVRRFACIVCDYQTTIFADGTNDLQDESEKAIEEIKEHFKQEKEARE